MGKTEKRNEPDTYGKGKYQRIRKNKKRVREVFERSRDHLKKKNKKR